MKKSFHVFFLFTLMAFFATVANAETVELQTDPVTSEKFVNMPYVYNEVVKDTLRISSDVATFKVYDNGGKDGNYSDVSNGYLVMIAPEGYVFRVSGNIDTESNWDPLKIYDGGWDGKEITTLSGYNPNVGPLFNSGNILTFYFKSDGADNGQGLDLTVSLIDASIEYRLTVSSAVGGSVNIAGDKTSAGAGETVTLTVSSNPGFVLDGVSVKGTEDGLSVNVSGGVWYSGSNTVTFVMPNKAVTVTPTFTDDVFINMSPMNSNNTPNAYIPSNVTSLKVYDNGGKDGHASGGGLLALTAPAGKALQVSGNVTFENGRFVIYDGLYDMYIIGQQPEYMYNVNRGSNITSVVSSSNVITIEFRPLVAYGGGGNNDLDLTVTVVDAPESNIITLVQGNGGTISASLDKAPLGKVVTITANCNSGYILESVSVVDAGGNPIAATGGWYSNNSASFRMPSSAVTVTPTFTNKKTAEDGLFINLPVLSTMISSVQVPKGVESFYVYDDGGRDAPYTVNSQSGLELYAPLGYVLLLTGSIDLGADASLHIIPESFTMEHDIFSGTQQDIGPYECEGVTLGLISEDGSEPNTHAGFTIKVELLQAAITIAQDKSGNSVATINGAYEGSSEVNVTFPNLVDTVVFNRTFSTAGYSTITLPFGINASKVEGLERAYAFDTMSTDANGKKEVQMVAVDSLAANTPYIIKVDDETLVFHGEARIVPMQDPVVKKGDWEFRGTLQKKIWSAGDEDLGRVYGYSAEATDKVTIGQFVKAAAGAWIRPFRAYLIYNPEDDGMGSAKTAGSAFGAAETLPDYMNVVVVSRDANGQEHKKVIGGIDTRTGEFKMQQDYDLKGRKLMNGRQKARGAYYGKMKVSK